RRPISPPPFRKTGWGTGLPGGVAPFSTSSARTYRARSESVLRDTSSTPASRRGTAAAEPGDAPARRMQARPVHRTEHPLRLRTLAGPSAIRGENKTHESTGAVSVGAGADHYRFRL